MTDVNGVLRERLAAARRRHTLLCVDTGTAVRITGRSLNTSTSVLTDTTTTVYTGAARLKRAVPAEQVAGDVDRGAAHPILVLPYSATDAGALRKGDVFTFTASSDAALVGRSVTVIGPEHGTTTSAHRYLVEEVTP